MNYMVRQRQNGDSYNLFNDFDAVLDNLFNRDYPAGQRSPLVDVRETEDHYTIEAELPGFSEKEIDVQVEDNVLSITARKEVSEEKDKKDSKKEDRFLLKERKFESFSRRFSLPGDVDIEQINGDYKNGVLTLSLAKRAEAKPRSIKVKAA
jgi:HSP20 family protein